MSSTAPEPSRRSRSKANGIPSVVLPSVATVVAPPAPQTAPTILEQSAAVAETNAPPGVAPGVVPPPPGPEASPEPVPVRQPARAEPVEALRPLRPYDPPKGEGWTEAAPLLVYDPDANDGEPVQGIVVDSREWGGGLDMIIMRPRAPLRVRLASGEVVEVAAKTSIAVPAVCQFLSVLAALQQTEEALEIAFAPVAVRTIGNGRSFTEYHVAWRPTGVPRRMLWTDT